MAPLALAAGIVLVGLAPTGRRPIGGAVFLAASVLLFGTSAIYHRCTWGPRGEAVLRRMDHANIYVFIAASYTPLALLLLTGSSRVLLLTMIWTAALGGLLFRLFWLWRRAGSTPRSTSLMGWAALGWLRRVLAAAGSRCCPDPGRRRCSTPPAPWSTRRKRPEPVTALVRLPRDLPRLHHRRLRLPLRRRSRWSPTRLDASSRSAQQLLRRAQLRPVGDRQPADEPPADVRGRPAVDAAADRPAGRTRAGRAPGHDHRTGRGSPVRRPDQLRLALRSARSPTTATWTGVAPPSG